MTKLQQMHYDNFIFFYFAQFDREKLSLGPVKLIVDKMHVDQVYEQRHLTLTSNVTRNVIYWTQTKVALHQGNTNNVSQIRPKSDISS